MVCEKNIDFTKFGFSDTLVLMKWQGKLLSNDWVRRTQGPKLPEVWIKIQTSDLQKSIPQNDENEPWTLKSLEKRGFFRWDSGPQLIVGGSLGGSLGILGWVY